MTTETKPRTQLYVDLWSTTRHPPQKRMVDSTSKRLVVKAGRRGGKTVGFAIRAVERFLQGRRQLYAAPTNEQTDTFWYEVKKALAEPIAAGLFKANESERFIELPGTKQRIKAKTAWNANTLRGDYADDLYLDEFQLMNEDAWDEVGAPMLLDNNGDAVFIFTPPSLKSAGVSKAKNPRHASKMFKKAQADTTGIWEAIHFTSLENPFISREGLAIITSDMSMDSYRREIMAQDDDIEQSWLVYGKFNEALNKIPRFTIPTNWPVFSGHDFGPANPGALFLAQAKLPLPEGAPPSMRYNDLVAFREYAPGGGISTPRHVDTFKEICGERTVAKSVGGSHTELGWRNDFNNHGWHVQEPQENMRRVLLQVDRVIGLMELNKFFIIDDLFVLLAQVANCMWKLDDENKPTNVIVNEAFYHLLACLRYIGSDFTPETVGTSSRPAVSGRGRFR